MRAALACLLVAAAPAGAHDLWIRPSSFQPEAGALVEVELRVGDHGRGEAVARDEARIVRFDVTPPGAGSAEAAGASPVVGRDGGLPAGLVRLEAAGTHVLAYRSTRARLELEAAKFERYLEEEGLDHVLAERRRQGRSATDGREVYSRCAKALVRVGAGPGSDRALGLDLELVVVGGDPFGPAGLPLEIELRHLGRPLSGALVEALPLGGVAQGDHDHEHGPGEAHGHAHPAAHVEAAGGPLAARTDERGRVELTLPERGPWLVAAVHMLPFAGPAEDPSPPSADWESLWASLTFEVADPGELAPTDEPARPSGS